MKASIHTCVVVMTPTIKAVRRVRTRNPVSNTSGQTETLSLSSTTHQTWLPYPFVNTPHALFTSPLWSTTTLLTLTMVYYYHYLFSSSLPLLLPTGKIFWVSLFSSQRAIGSQVCSQRCRQ